MPILHRNIGAPSHAGAADNGKIVFRQNAPSHQRDMAFSMELSGTIDFAPFFRSGGPYDGQDPADFIVTSFDAARLAASPGVFVNTRNYGGMAAVPGLHLNHGYGYVTDAAGEKVAYVGAYGFGAWVGIEWGAASWRWVARLSGGGLDLVYGPPGGLRPTHPTTRWFTYDPYTNPGGSYALYKSPASVAAIRLGANGWDLDFDSVHGSDAAAGVEDILADVAMTIKAQYA